jgi:hypothetical protein
MKLKPHDEMKVGKKKMAIEPRSRSLPKQTSASLLHQRPDDCRDAK